MNSPPSDNAEVVAPSEADPAALIPQDVSVVAVVTAVAGVDPAATLEAVAGQDHPATSVRLIGSQDPEIPTGVVMNEDLAAVVAELDPSVEYVWVLHGDAQPRPDALRALILEADRFEASLAGSKLLVAGTADTLESVGSATDVFGEPYSGLDEGEVDLEQYDVVRDVAYVSSVSMLVRRDLLRGLRGVDSSLAPNAAGLDLSQRVRIAGGRVIVVPSSEVFHQRRCGRGDGGWREQSGRMRAMLKAYRPITLLWMVPFAIITGILDSLGSLLLGRWRLGPRYVLTWGWNLVHLPSTLVARRNLARVRQVGDEELFRYQVRGSTRLRLVGSEISDRLLTIFDDESAVTRRAAEVWSSPVTWGVILALVVVAVGLRSVFLGGLPVVGYALPLDDASDSLARFLGDWNPAGMGSGTPVHPSTGPTAVAHLLAFGHGGLARSLVTVAAFVVGVLGVGRLAGRLGVGGPGAYLAGLVAMFGLPAAILTRDGRWAALVAVGVLPWALSAVIGPAAADRRSWLGQVGRAVVLVALTACFVPVLAVAPILFALGVKAIGRFPARLSVAAAATLGGTVALPYLLSGRDWLGGVPIRIEIGVIFLVVLAVTSVLAMVARSWRAGALGGSMAFGGLALSKLVGPDLQTGLLAVAAVGAGLVVAVALRPGDRNPVAWSGLVGAGVVLILSFAGLSGGRAGLPPDQWGDQLGFMTLGSSGAERALLIAPEPYRLPGDSVAGPGFWYRLVQTDGVTLDQAVQGPPGLGDEALAAAVARVFSGATLEPGQELAPFGVRWVIATQEASELVSPPLQAQTDLIPNPFAEGLLVFENVSVSPVAAAADGTPWEFRSTGFGGPPVDGRVRLAVNAYPGWQPDWEQDDWGLTVSGSMGEASYRAPGWERPTMIGGVVIFLLGLGLGVWGRGKR